MRWLNVGVWTTVVAEKKIKLKCAQKCASGTTLRLQVTWICWENTQSSLKHVTSTQGQLLLFRVTFIQIRLFDYFWFLSASSFLFFCRWDRFLSRWRLEVTCHSDEFVMCGIDGFRVLKWSGTYVEVTCWSDGWMEVSGAKAWVKVRKIDRTCVKVKKKN